MAVQRSSYIIKFSGLPKGKHEYVFEINNKFFENRDVSIIKNANLTANVSLLKESGPLQLTLKISGEIGVECVRCLEEFMLPINIENTLVVRQIENPNSEDDDDDSIHIQLNATELDLDVHLYDFIVLQVPYSPVHPDNADGVPNCNPEILKFLSKKEDSTKQDEPANDRWAILKNIKLN